MRINTNVSALNSLSNLNKVQDMVGKSMQKLSSGFRINRAGDDAAGLGIANQMRADTKAMGQASRNAEQAGSVLQVMDGASQNVQTILERMKELAAQSASDSVDSTARTKINNEFKSLSGELDRIVDTTKFQGQTLLKGSFGSATSRAVDSTVSHTYTEGSVNITNQSALNQVSSNITVSTTQNNASITAGTVNAVAGITGVSVVTQANAKTFQAGLYSVAWNAGSSKFDLKDAGGSVVDTSASSYVAGANVVFTAAGITIAGDASTDVSGAAGAGKIDTKNFTLNQSFQVQLAGTGASTQAQTLTVDGSAKTLTFSNFGVSLGVTALSNKIGAGSYAAGVVSNSSDVIGLKNSTQAQFLVSSSQNYTGADLISLNTVDLQASTLGVDQGSVDLSTAAGAEAALTKIDGAINTVGAALGDIGAAENRVDIANTNVKTTIQNYTAAESVIRDVDMADEMTSFSKNQILSQAGTAILAQANQLGQGVLQLLRG